MKLALLFIPFLLAAQTAVALFQLRLGSPAEVDKLRLFAVGLSGMIQVSTGPGLRLETFDGGIRIVAVQPTYRLRSAVLKPSPDGSYTFPRWWRVVRNNGIPLIEGDDYTHDGTSAKFKTPARQDDIYRGEWIEAVSP